MLGNEDMRGYGAGVDNCPEGTPNNHNFDNRLYSVQTFLGVGFRFSGLWLKNTGNALASSGLSCNSPN